MRMSEHARRLLLFWPAETMDHHMMVLFARLEHGAREVRTVDRIRIVLGFQTEAAMLLIDRSRFPRFLVQEVAGIELHAGLGGVDVHAAIMTSQKNLPKMRSIS